MNTRESNKLLKDTLDFNEDLIQFAEECLKKIYGTDGDYAVALFNEDLNFRDYNGCIQSLRSIDSKIEDFRLRRAEKA